MKLAILGGKPIVKKNAFYSWPPTTKNEITLLVEKFKHLSFNNYKLDEDVISFEKEFAQFVETKYCFTLNSGTAALYSSLIACDLKNDENVILPAYSFFSAGTAIQNSGAKVKFCDVDPDTFTIDPKSFEEQIDENTRAVIVVHIFGNPCNMDEILKIAKKNNILVIEDACQAHGSTYKNRRVGGLGDIAAFSFHISKNLPIMEGGAITTNNMELRDKAASTNLFPNYIKNKYPVEGNNFKFNGLFATIGRSRLEHLNNYNNRRKENRDYLVNKLKKYNYIIPQKSLPNAESSNSMFVFKIDHKLLNISSNLLKSRNLYLFALHKEGINCGVWLDKILPDMDMFDKTDEQFPISQHLVDSTIYISGIHFPNDKKQMDLIVSAIDKIDRSLADLKQLK